MHLSGSFRIHCLIRQSVGLIPIGRRANFERVIVAGAVRMSRLIALLLSVPNNGIRVRGWVCMAARCNRQAWTKSHTSARSKLLPC